MIKEAIVLAGGLGTRLKSVVKDIPKPMADVNGKPFLEYLLRYLRKNSIERIILSVGYKWEVIRDYFGKSFENMELVYSVESEPLGTGGAIKRSLSFVNSDNIFILNGDTFFDINLKDFLAFHKKRNSVLSVALKSMKQFDRYGVVKIDKDNRIVAFKEKAYYKFGLINGGIYLLNKLFFRELNFESKFSFEKDLLEIYYKVYNFYGFPFEAYFVDIGIPEDYERAKRDFLLVKNNLGLK